MIQPAAYPLTVAARYVPDTGDPSRPLAMLQVWGPLIGPPVVVVVVGPGVVVTTYTHLLSISPLR
jgi:hypothetical protein